MGITWKDVGETVAKAAPIVGGILGGPVGAGVVGLGSLLAGALGVDNTPEAVQNALINDPAAMAKVIEVQENSKVKLQELYFQGLQNEMLHEQATLKIASEDRNSARELMKSQPEDNTRQYITYMMILGAVGIVVCIFSGVAEELLKNATSSLTIGTVIGYWFNELKQIMAFWFGTVKENTGNEFKLRLPGIKPKEQQ